MARLRSNVLLPALVLIGIGVAGGVAYVEITGERPNFVLFQPRATIERPPHEPDADTPTDTIRRLQAEMKSTNTYAQSLIKQNEKLQVEVNKLRGQEARIREDLRNDLLNTSKADRESEQRDSRAQFEALGKEIAGLRSQLAERPAPVALSPQAPLPADGAYQWMDPLDRLDPKADPRRSAVRTASLTDGAGGRPATALPSGSAAAAATGGAVDRLERMVRPATPWFTIPPLSSLVGSTALTAMIGRIPRNGSVQDAVPFRVLVGRDNLAASGLFVPEAVFGMVFEGTAIGDYALSCAYGNITAATFIFQDGTIRSVNLRQGNGTAGGGGGGASWGGGRGGADTRLAYVADRFGTPCISGTRVGNAEQILGLRVALTAAEAAAEAAAAAQTTSTTGSALGTTTTSVTGNLGPYIVGKTASNGFKEIDKFFADRINDIFEAVFVPAGREMAIMIQQEITLDHEPDGRKLDYGVQTNGSRSHLD